jgi:signal transduction histidine kinase
VDVSVEVDPGGDLTLRVADNGIGIPPDARRSGLRNLAQRADKLGGELRLGPAGPAGAGTELTWRVPREGR